MVLTIRRAEIGDNAGIINLLKQIGILHHKGRPDIFKKSCQKYGKDEFEAMLKDENRPVFVAVDGGGKILGYCFCMITRYESHPVFTDYTALYIDDFCVDENCRGQGAGKKIFAAVKAYAKQVGAYNIDLNVWEFNETAVKFYESCGFETKSRKMEMIL
ncbi:MAG: GNAT family N-acetyltransferase [Oscillospiraceae bacterium]|nr:GNAT family N-acetyltransferase [Oscillospiraceae bacterium]